MKKLGLYERAGLAKSIYIRCAETPLAQCFLAMLARPRRRPLNIAGRTAEARRRSRLDDTVTFYKGAAMLVMRMLRRFGHT